MHVFHVFGLLKTAIVDADSDNFVKVLSPKYCSLSGSRARWVSTIRLPSAMNPNIFLLSHHDIISLASLGAVIKINALQIKAIPSPERL